jgi:hypothetical protein
MVPTPATEYPKNHPRIRSTISSSIKPTSDLPGNVCAPPCARPIVRETRRPGLEQVRGAPPSVVARDQARHREGQRNGKLHDGECLISGARNHDEARGERHPGENPIKGAPPADVSLPSAGFTKSTGGRYLLTRPAPRIGPSESVEGVWTQTGGRPGLSAKVSPRRQCLYVRHSRCQRPGAVHAGCTLVLTSESPGFCVLWTPPRPPWPLSSFSFVFPALYSSQ